ncbi:MAG: hypothetical protein IPJ47_13640 [Anaerolineales bacterium]|nr:hypothetical protein [Anaerolineales bacterium]
MATGERILIVENDPDITDLIGRQSLQPLGFKVVVGRLVLRLKLRFRLRLI